MRYFEFAPTGVLQPYIKCIWALEAEAAGPTGEYEKILPDGCPELLFHYGAPFEKKDGHGAHLQTHFFVHGQLSRYIELKPTAETGVIGVRFKPFGLAAFTGLPQFRLKDDTFSVDSVFSCADSYIAERINEAETIKGKIIVLENFLVKNLLVNKKTFRHDTINGLAYAVNEIKASAGNVNLDGIACRLNISGREIERRFRTCIGLSPKQLSKIFRFNQVLNKSAHIADLTHMAYLAGYYDQSHFIRDFREFSGVNPSTFFKQENKFTEFFYDK